MAETLVVSEVFGPTIQGEGPLTGQRAIFVRLGRCNLDCSWCDTPFTWDWKGKNGTKYDPSQELTIESVVDVIARVRALAGPSPALTVISGGEPLLQASGLERLIAGLGVTQIETNGTRPPLNLEPLQRRPFYSISPKLAHSGVDRSIAIKPEVLEQFVDLIGTSFKFVVKTRQDLDEVQAIADEVGIPSKLIWVMPEGRTEAAIDERLRDLAQASIDRGWNISGRTHVTIWGDQRGH